MTAEPQITAAKSRVPDSVEAINNLYYARGWSDGLPIVPPTEDRVQAMLAFTDYGSQDIVAILPPKYGEATAEKIAINAVMAGCLPQYLPVVIAALHAMAEPQFNLYGVQATTHQCAPLTIVNGPVAAELEINSGYNAFGQGWRANATIGRAIRLALMNIGGGRPGVLDRATFGSPAKFAYCAAENEEANPWEPLHVELGYSPETSTVTVVAAEGPHNVNDHGSTQGAGILLTCAGALASPATNNVYLGGNPVLVLGPEHAETVARDGFNKQSIKQFVWEHATLAVEKFHHENVDRFLKMNPDWCPPDRPPGYLVPGWRAPEDLLVVVIGGAGKHSAVLPTFGENKAVTKPIAFRDGTPAASVEAFKRA